MDYIIYGLFGLSIVVLIVSWLIPNRVKQLETEMNEFSYQVIQDTYQLKKRMKVLEEELLVDPSPLFKETKKTNYNQIIVNQVLSLYKQGISIDKIASQSALSKADVETILRNRSG